jgi:hypothetical protein
MVLVLRPPAVQADSAKVEVMANIISKTTSLATVIPRKVFVKVPLAFVSLMTARAEEADLSSIKVPTKTETFARQTGVNELKNGMTGAINAVAAGRIKKEATTICTLKTIRKCTNDEAYSSHINHNDFEQVSNLREIEFRTSTECNGSQGEVTDERQVQQVLRIDQIKAKWANKCSSDEVSSDQGELQPKKKQLLTGVGSQTRGLVLGNMLSNHRGSKSQQTEF